VPLAMVPVLAPSRWLLAVPAFAYCLLSTNPQMQSPLFHFHAPIVPLLVLAAVQGVGNLADAAARQRRRPPPDTPPNDPPDPTDADAVRRDRARWAARLVFWAALISGVWNSKSPLSVTFYDPAMETDGYWGALYVPDARVDAFWKVYAMIPPEARVASTDWVRPRFTHHRVCHDLPLRSHVGLDDVDYLVYDMKDPWWEDKILQDPWVTGRTADAPLVALRARGPARGPTTQARDVRADAVFRRWVRQLRHLPIRAYPADVVRPLLAVRHDFEPVHLGPCFWVFKRRSFRAAPGPTGANP